MENPNGIIEQIAFIDIYPNPSNGKLFIKNPNQKLLDIQISNQIGKKAWILRKQNEPIIELDLSVLSSGLYMIHVLFDNQQMDFKVLLNE